MKQPVCHYRVITANPSTVAELDKLSDHGKPVSGVTVQKLPPPVPELELDTDPAAMHMFAVLAERNRKLLSARTKAGLRAAKERGVRLGNPRLVEIRAGVNARAAARADAFAETVRPQISKAIEQGARSLQEIAEWLNANGVPTTRGGRWAASDPFRKFLAILLSL